MSPSRQDELRTAAAKIHEVAQIIAVHRKGETQLVEALVKIAGEIAADG